MTNEFEKQLLKEIFRIADQLIQSNKVNPQGTIWKTFSYNDRYDPPIFYEEKEGLYNGISGILFFLYSLHELHQDDRLAEMINVVKRRLIGIVLSNQEFSYSYYTGRIGTLYCLSKVCHDNKEKIVYSAIEKNLNFIHHQLKQQGVEKCIPKDDLLLGKSGAILGLLKIYELIELPVCYEIIQLLTISLISNHSCPKRLKKSADE